MVFVYCSWWSSTNEGTTKCTIQNNTTFCNETLRMAATAQNMVFVHCLWSPEANHHVLRFISYNLGDSVFRSHVYCRFSTLRSPFRMPRCLNWVYQWGETFGKEKYMTTYRHKQATRIIGTKGADTRLEVELRYVHQTDAPSPCSIAQTKHLGLEHNTDITERKTEHMPRSNGWHKVVS